MSTWSEIQQEIIDEYDLAEETFIDEDEMKAAANEAIDDIESEIHSIHDKYFETEVYLTITQGESLFDKPYDIYANKITLILFDDGHNKYEIKPIKDKRVIPDICANDDYQYRIVNSTAGGTKIKFYPEVRESSASFVTVHYIRRAKHFSLDTDVLDIPEGKSFIKQYVVDYAVNKERMTPDAPESAALKRKRTLLIEVLTSMIPDDNNQLEADFSWYDDMVCIGS